MKNKMIALMMCVVLLFVFAVGECTNKTPVKAETQENEGSYGLQNPRNIDDVMTWVCSWFGNYWQEDTNGDGDATTEDEKQPIKWRVLSVEGTDALLLAENCLDAKQYNDTQVEVTWETCTLRQWLNGEFLQAAFNENEQKAIPKVTLENEDNPDYNTDGGASTEDSIFLLSISEISNTAYGFAEDPDAESSTRVSKATPFAIANGGFARSADKAATLENLGCSSWWLRCPGYRQKDAAMVVTDGWTYENGNPVDMTTETVRPALHINLSSGMWKKAGTVNANGEVTEAPEESEEATQTAAPVQTATPTQTVAPAPTTNVESNKATKSELSAVSSKDKPETVSGVKAKVITKKSSSKTKKISLSWKKSKGAKGYEIQYASNKKFKNRKQIRTVKTKVTFTKKKKTYYVRVRAYKKENGKKIYGAWSSVKKIK